MNTRLGAVIAIASVAAVAGALVVRQNVALGQSRQRDAEQAQLQTQQAELLDRLRKLETQKAELEEQAAKLQAELAEKRELIRQRLAAEEQSVKPELQRVARPAQPHRWEYRVLSVAQQDEDMNAVMKQLTNDGWEYVTVTHPSDSGGTARVRVLFRRLSKGAP